jgi:hypothetical protein
VREASNADAIAVVVPLPTSVRPGAAAERHRRSPRRSIGSGPRFYSKNIASYELELGRPGIWLRIDLEKPPSTQMSCPVT